MAITGFWPIKDGIARVIDYAANPEKTTDDLKNVLRYTSDPDKTEKLMYVSALNCPWRQAYEWMTATKKRFGKTGGNTAYHGFQSFKGDEVSPEEAHAIGMETAKRMWGDDYEVLVCTHLNTGNVHNHFVINSVSFRTGRKYENHKRDHKLLRDVSDSLCREHGLYVLDSPGGRSMSYAEWRAHRDGMPTNKELLETDMRECISLAGDVEDFFKLMADKGYEITRGGKYPTFRFGGWKRGLRLKDNGESLTETGIERLLDESYDNQPERIIIPRYEKPFVPYEKAKGFRALVLSWMYVLGIIGKGKKTVFRVDREEVKRFYRYKRQNDFLERYGIDTAEQLDEHVSRLTDEREALIKRRDVLRKLQRKTGEPDPEIGEITKQLRRIRSELTVCGNIREDTPKMQRAFDEYYEYGTPDYQYER